MSISVSLRISGLETPVSSTSILAASSKRRVNTYPCISSSIGSPIGAYFTTVISAPGITPMSRKCCLSAPSPFSLLTLTLSPIFTSFKVFTCFSSYLSCAVSKRTDYVKSVSAALYKGILPLFSADFKDQRVSGLATARLIISAVFSAHLLYPCSVRCRRSGHL